MYFTVLDTSEGQQTQFCSCNHICHDVAPNAQVTRNLHIHLHELLSHDTMMTALWANDFCWEEASS